MSGTPPHSLGRLRKPVVGGLLLNALLAALAAGLFVAPRLLEGHAALLWTRHYAARVAGPPAGEHARQALRWGLRAMGLTAPLPPAAEAARLVLASGRKIEVKDAAAALALYGEVGAELDRLSSSRVRGRGLAGLAAEAREEEARTRAAIAGARQK
ncbi:MAG TPA: hypothetical protein VN461_07580 [Vicinamibacteria bacterium]|nr:hypothetical protein [Vicinamibacteria bacterium]